MTIQEAIAGKISVEIDGKRQLIQKTVNVARPDVRLEDPSQSTVRVTYAFDGREYGIDVAYQAGHREEAIMFGIAAIERDVNLAEYRKAHPSPKPPVGGTDGHPAQRTNAAIGAGRIQKRQILAEAKAVKDNRHFVLTFADALNAYQSAKALVGLHPSAVEQAEANLVSAYGDILKPLADIVAAQLTIVSGRRFAQCPE